MSIQATSWALAQDIPFPGRKLTLIALANYADEHAQCYPGQKTLAKDISQCERTVRSHLLALEQDGWITRTRRLRENGTRTSDGYQLNLPATIAGSHEGQPATSRETNRQKPDNQPATGCRATNRKGNRTEETSDSESSGLSSDDDGSRIIASKMVEVYHERCPSLTKVLVFSSARRGTALARFRDLGGMMSNWEAYCDQIEASDFLAGRKTDFVAGWDFITNKANYVKVMEGRYVNRGQKNGNSKNAGDAYREALAGVPGGSSKSP